MARRKTNIWHSFLAAFQGIYQFFRNDPHGKFHLISAVLVTVLGCLTGLTRYEWLLIAICIASVFTSEMINASIEKLCDVVQPDYDLQIKRIKDMAAGAVLIVSLVSVIVAIGIFLPKILR